MVHARMTTTLIADRFVVRAAGSALDLATGGRVRLRIEPAGTRAAQQEWTDACTRAHAKGTLLDFGFIGCGERFEARPQRSASSSSCRAQETTEIVEWLDEGRPSSSRVLQVAELPDAPVAPRQLAQQAPPHRMAREPQNVGWSVAGRCRHWAGDYIKTD